MNHIHLGSKNIGRSMEFYETFFGFKKKFDHGDGVFIENDKSFLIAISKVEELPKFPSWFHMGFCLQSKNEVKAIFDKMISLDVEFATKYEEYGEDAAAFYAYDPDGYKIEVSWHNE